MIETRKHIICIEFCTQCRWMLRATWMGQELLQTFDREITELRLKPSNGGIFRIYANDNIIWDRKLDEGFPEITTLKQRVRDQIAPDKSLGHIDRPKK